MDFFELIHRRYSARAYLQEVVDDAKLERILEAARLAPTAANRQPFRVLVVHTEGRGGQLRRIYHREWFVQAPILLFVCGFQSRAWTRRDGWSAMQVDAAIVMDHMILAAAAQGLGTCWVANFDPDAAREILGLPEDVQPLLATPLGYPADQPSQKERKPVADLVSYEKWTG
jgi:nitroreductase